MTQEELRVLCLHPKAASGRLKIGSLTPTYSHILFSSGVERQKFPEEKVWRGQVSTTSLYEEMQVKELLLDPPTSCLGFSS